MASVVICDRCGERMEKLSERDACQYKVIWDHKRLDLCPKCKDALGKFLKMGDSKNCEGGCIDPCEADFVIGFSNSASANLFVEFLKDTANSWGCITGNDIKDELNTCRYKSRVEYMTDWDTFGEMAWSTQQILNDVKALEDKIAGGRVVYQVTLPIPFYLR